MPILPQLTVDTTYSLPTGTQYTVGAGMDYTNLQTAINAAALGDVLILTAGETFSGNFTLPDKGAGTDWIYIISSDLVSLTEGVRVLPGDVASMPTIETVNTEAAVRSFRSAHHYRFAGVHFTVDVAIYQLIRLGFSEVDDLPVTTEADLPHHITFDRCWITSTSTSNQLVNGILADGKYIGVIDSYIDNVKGLGPESQAIGVWGHGIGPYKIENNFLEATCENIMFGGESISITNAIPSDIVIHKNHFYKRPEWNPSDPLYGGVNWKVKNLLELKIARRAHVSGNVFENSWQGAQAANGIVLTVRNQYGDAPQAILEDLTLENNLIRNVSIGISLSAEDDLQVSQQTQRVLIRNNLMHDITDDTYALPRFVSFHAETVPILYLTIRHNTCVISLDEAGYSPVIFEGNTTVKIDNFVFENNIMSHGFYGMGSIDVHLANYTLLNNGLIFSDLTTEDNWYWDNFYGAAGNPASYIKVAVVADVDFVNEATGDFALLGTSPFYQAGSDGEDVGANIAELNAATAGVT